MSPLAIIGAVIAAVWAFMGVVLGRAYRKDKVELTQGIAAR